jgi:DoxX-like family
MWMNPLPEITMAASLLQHTTYVAPRTTPSLVSRKALWAGRIITGLVALLMAMDAAMKLSHAKVAVEASATLGFSSDQVFVIGIIAAVCLVLYLVPLTAPLGAVLWTGYFGGAVVTNLRGGYPLFTHILSGVYVAILIWVSLYLRDARVRGLVSRSR